MKKGKKILITTLIIIVFIGIVFFTYKVLAERQRANKNQEYKLNGYIIKTIEKQKDDFDDNVLDENIILEEHTTTETNNVNITKQIMYDGILSETNLEYDDNSIGIIEVPKIGLVAPIKDGTDLEILAKYVGHFSNSSVWDGNVALAAHNRGTSVKHYFDRINELVNGDIIIYKSKLGERTYEVISSKEIASTDWSVTENNANENNTITLITCIKNQPEKRLCIVAKEKN